MNARIDYSALTERRCSSCKATKLVVEFNWYTDPAQPTNGWRYYSQCRHCQNNASREYGAANRPRRNARLRDWRKANPEAAKAKDRRTRFMVKYGLTEDALQSLMDRHGGRCWLCLSRPAAVVDHDHVTGHVRGVTCHGCNSVVLSRADADPTYLHRVREYLDQACHADILLRVAAGEAP